MMQWQTPNSMPRLGYYSERAINGRPIPDGTAHVELVADCSLREGYIPSSVTYLDLGGFFNQPLQTGHIPNSVTHLDLGYVFNQPLQAGHIPVSVTHLVLSDYYDIPLEMGHIPDGVTHLTLGVRYNQPLQVGSIPNSVTHLMIGGLFRQNLEPEHLPENLVAIRCRYYNNIEFLSKVPSHIRIYVIPNRVFNSDFTLRNMPHPVYIQSSEHDQDIIDGRINGVHYINTVEEDGTNYLLVHGDDYERPHESA